MTPDSDYIFETDGRSLISFFFDILIEEYDCHDEYSTMWGSGVSLSDTVSELMKKYINTRFDRKSQDGYIVTVDGKYAIEFKLKYDDYFKNR